MIDDEHEDDDKGDVGDDNILCVTDVAFYGMMIARRMVIRMQTVKTTIIVARSALPMVPSASIERYLKKIRKG